MLVIKGIRYRNKFLIPAIIPTLVTADQQNRTAARVKGKEHPIRPSQMLYPKFLQVRMARRVDEIGMRTGKTRANFLKQDHLGVHVHLFSLGEAIPPIRKFVGKFDLSFHRRNIAHELCCVKDA